MEGKHPFDRSVRVVLMTVGVLAVMAGPGRAMRLTRRSTRGSSR